MFKAPVIQQSIPKFHAFGVEKRHPERFFVKAEEIQRLANLVERSRSAAPARLLGGTA